MESCQETFVTKDRQGSPFAAFGTAWVIACTLTCKFDAFLPKVNCHLTNLALVRLVAGQMVEGLCLQKGFFVYLKFIWFAKLWLGNVSYICCDDLFRYIVISFLCFGRQFS